MSLAIHEKMTSAHVPKISLYWALIPLLLNGFTVHAQEFLEPASDVDVLGVVNGSIELLWTYSTPFLSGTEITCAARKRNIIYKREKRDPNILPEFAGKATLIYTTIFLPFTIGFRLTNLGFSDANVYTCTLRFGSTTNHSRKYNLTIYDLPAAPLKVKLVQSTPESIWIKWTAPRQPRSSYITKYLMELIYPNGTIIMKNYTIVPSNPILEYTFYNLLPNVRYVIHVSAYNAYGKGQRSSLVEYETVYNGNILPTAPLNIKLIESTFNSIRIKWTAPEKEGISPIIWYLLDLYYLNGTTTTNYTIDFSNPILDYTFKSLSAQTKYGISITAYNTFGKGPRSAVVQYLTVNFKTSIAVGIHYGLNANFVFCMFIGILFMLYWS